MKVYLKKKSEKYWHWELECPEYPEASEVERVYRKPAKEKLCRICIQIEAQGKIKSQNKDILGDDSLL